MFLTAYARKIERDPLASAVFEQDQAERARYQHLQLDTLAETAPRSKAATAWFLAFLGLIVVLLIEFFVTSGSAKAFLLMPILLPLADLVGITRQLTITAYCFGDGFSNLVYPTNPVLLICPGLTVVSYPTWLRWTLKLWAGILLVTVIFLAAGVAIRLGPF